MFSTAYRTAGELIAKNVGHRMSEEASALEYRVDRWRGTLMVRVERTR